MDMLGLTDDELAALLENSGPKRKAAPVEADAARKRIAEQLTTRVSSVTRVDVHYTVRAPSRLRSQGGSLRRGARAHHPQ